MTLSESDPPEAGSAKRQRIAKLIARAGLCSRRDAEAWIVEGRVSLNGTVLTSPAMDVSADDVVLVDGEPLPLAEKTRLFLFHKPRGLVTTDRDPEGRETVADFLRENWPEGPRIVTVGRLDINTEGLLLLTNDGGLARVLELPSTGWVRRYRVRAKGAADPAALDALADGITIDGVDYAGIEAKLDRVQGANTWLTMGLREGKNREIKRVLEHLGLEVNRLIRLSFGPFQLLEIPEGAVEEVRTRVLRDQLGPALAAQAGVDLGDAPPAAKPAPAPSRGDRAPEDRRRGAPTERPRRNDRSRGPGPNHATASRPRGRHTPDDAPPPKRERPTSGPRKHVSTLRAEKASPAPTRGRVRIERTDTLDRRERTIQVERLVSTRAPANENAQRRPPRDRVRPADDNRSRGREDRRRPRETDAGNGHRDRAPERGQRRPDDRARRGPERRHESESAAPRRPRASPSAAGKQARIARSGGRNGPDGRDDERPQGRGAKPSRPGRSSQDRAEGAKPPRGPRKDGPRSARPPSSRPASSRPPSSRPASSRPSSSRPSSSRPSSSRSAGAKGAPKGPGRKPPRGPSKPRR